MNRHDDQERRGRRAAVRRTISYGLLICLAVLFAGYLWICFSIRHSVREISAQALLEYPGDRVEALVKYVESEDHSLRQRDRAVWALGQIGDRRALPTLEKFRTGKPCNHDTTLCQGEIEKAINACSGAFNATAWLPR